ncbi:MAG: alpha/beta fold hydrolase [Faecousia sp.]
MKYLFLHGMGQRAASWEETISLLPEDTEAVCPELSGFLTEGGCQYSRLYAAFCDFCGSISGPVNLCGLSLGAVLALNYAIDFPGRVNSLILIAPQFEMPKFLLKVQNVLFRFLPESRFDEIGLKKRDFITLTNSMADMDFTDRLDRVTCPVRILCGERDTVNQKAAVKLAERLPNAQYGTIANAGHTVNTDNPRELAQAIIKAQIS